MLNSNTTAQDIFLLLLLCIVSLWVFSPLLLLHFWRPSSFSCVTYQSLFEASAYQLAFSWLPGTLTAIPHSPADLQVCTRRLLHTWRWEKSADPSLSHFLTWHFHVSNLNSIICSLLCWVRKVIALTQAICILEGVRIKNVLLPP